MEEHQIEIYGTLKEEHDGVKEILEQLEEAKPGQRMKLLEKLKGELVPHARGEEKTLYALLLKQDSEKAQELSNEAYEEHLAVDKLMKELEEGDASEDRWEGKFAVLKENLEHHIEEEEEEIFPLAKKLFSSEEAVEINTHYLRVKEEFAKTLPPQSRISEEKVDAKLAKRMDPDKEIRHSA